MRRSRAASLLGLSLAWLLAAGCASPMSQEDLDDRLRVAAASVQGLQGRLLYFPVYADSRAAAWTLQAESQSDDSPLARRLYHDLRRGGTQRIGVVVGGPYPGLTRLVVVDAFELLEERPVPGLTLVYVGHAKQASALRKLARAHRARFYHRELR